MKCREDEVAGLCSGKSDLDGFKVSHLADQNDVRVLTEDRTETVGVGTRVGADLALVDDTFVGLIDVLDRVLKRDDMLISRVIDLVEDRGERRRFTGACLAGHEDDALVIGWKVVDHLRKAENGQWRDTVTEDTKGGGDIALLAEEIDTDTLAGDRTACVELTNVLDEVVAAARHLTRQLLTVVVGEWGVNDVLDLPIDTALRWQARDKMHVGCALFRGSGYQVFYVHEITLSFHECQTLPTTDVSPPRRIHAHVTDTTPSECANISLYTSDPAKTSFLLTIIEIFHVGFNEFFLNI